jgi:hypothetical protein
LSNLIVRPEVQRALDNLSDRELEAYERYKGPPLAPSVQAQLYELFLNGYDADAIQKLNPNFNLGMIVRARVDGLWDERKAAHVTGLLDGVRERVQTIQMESVHFMANLLAAAHKLHGDKLKRYLQTGDESVLGDISIKSLDGYRKAAELLLKLTGQDQKQTQVVKGEVKHTHSVEGVGGRPLTPEEAAGFLAIVDKDAK